MQKNLSNLAGCGAESESFFKKSFSVYVTAVSLREDRWSVETH